MIIGGHAMLGVDERDFESIDATLTDLTGDCRRAARPEWVEVLIALDLPADSGPHAGWAPGWMNSR